MTRGLAAMAASGVALAVGAVVAWRSATRPVVVPHHAPVVVLAAPRLAPVVVRALASALPRRADPFARAAVGERVPVELTAYCLQGFTRRDHWVRDGIVAADPRVFPLGRFVEVFVGSRYRGRYLVDDTGLRIKGQILDIWMPACDAARRFGRRRGTAVLLARGQRQPRPAEK